MGEPRQRNGAGAAGGAEADSGHGGRGVSAPQRPAGAETGAAVAARGGEAGPANGSAAGTGPGAAVGNGHGSKASGGVGGTARSQAAPAPADGAGGRARAGSAAARAYARTKGVRYDMAGLAAVFAVATVALGYTLQWTFAELPEGTLQLPTSLEAAQRMGEALTEFTETHYWHVVAGHAAAYIYLQTFAIPGTVFVNLLGGALLGMSVGFPLCLCYNTVGSVFLYLLSARFGRKLSRRFLAKRLDEFRETLDEHVAGREEQAMASGEVWRGGFALWTYMTFLRIFPFTPNWFMNVAAAQLHVRLPTFAAAVFVGLTPYNFFSCRAGLVLAQLKSRSDIMDAQLTGQLAAIAVIGMLLPTLAKRYGLFPEPTKKKKAA